MRFLHFSHDVTADIAVDMQSGLRSSPPKKCDVIKKICFYKVNIESHNFD